MNAEPALLCESRLVQSNICFLASPGGLKHLACNKSSLLTVRLFRQDEATAVHFAGGGDSAECCGKLLCTSAGKTSITKTETLSPGPKGPGTSRFTGGRLCR